MPEALDALHSSVDRLRALVGPLGDEVTRQAYPTEWTIADVVSHLGSGAVIFRQRLEDALAGRPTPDDFNQSVWAEWDSKEPRDKADDGLRADAAYMERLDAVTPEERSSVKISMGPLDLGWDQIVGMRLNEHVLHEWDVAVALDPFVALAPEGTAHVIDNLAMIARFRAKPDGKSRSLVIRTSAPRRTFVLKSSTDAVELVSGGKDEEPELTMPAESFVRLVYGRLDPEHTPMDVEGDATVLDELREVFRES